MGSVLPRFRRRLLLAASVLLVCTAGGCKQGSWTLWVSYSSRFIDSQGRVIDPQGDSRSTSEGQAYALFFALVANDRTTFERVLNWTQANMAGGDLQTHLPGWLWGKDQSGAWKTIDSNSAADADVWLAYDLLEAGRLWKQSSYGTLGHRIMEQIAKAEVADLPGFGPMLLPGSAGFVHDKAWTLNPSYLPLFILERFAVVDPGGPWQKIALGLPRFLQQSARRGFAMDWVDYLPGDGFYPAPEHPGKGASAPVGSYDAIRVYLWAGMLDPSGPVRADLLDAIPGMAAYLGNHDVPPEKVSDQGIPMEQDGPVGFSAALLPYLRAIPGMEKGNAKQTIRLAKERNDTTGLYGKVPTYYDQNLSLFSMGYLDGRFRFGPGGDLKVGWIR